MFPTRQYRARHAPGVASRGLIRVSASSLGGIGVDIHHTFPVVAVCANITVIVAAVSIILHLAIAISVDRAARTAAVVIVSVSVSTIIFARGCVAAPG